MESNVNPGFIKWMVLGGNDLPVPGVAELTVRDDQEEDPVTRTTEENRARMQGLRSTDGRILSIREVDMMSDSQLLAEALKYLGMLRVQSEFSGRCKQTVVDTILALRHRLAAPRDPIGVALIPSSGDEYGHMIIEGTHTTDQADIADTIRVSVRIHRYFVAACGKRSEPDEEIKLDWHGDICRACWNKFPIIREENGATD